MSYGNYQSVPFWDFVRSFDNSGAGVDHPAQDSSFFGPPPPQGPQGGPPHPHPHPTGFPFGGGPFGGGPFGPRGFGPGAWGRGGHTGRGRCNRRDGSHERSGSQSGECADGEAREHSPHGPHGPHHGGPGRHGRGGHRGFGGHGRRGRAGFMGQHGAELPFDLNALVEAFAAHPIAQAFRTYAEQNGFGADGARSGETLVPDDIDSESSFTPPIDVFSTETEYVLHIALPGAKKEDVGVNWDAEKGVLNVAGVVYRQGDEEFLKTLSKSERKVGVFERTVKLPPGNEEKEEVDGDNITAKLEDGILVVSVPKIEKEWTEVKKVDIV